MISIEQCESRHSLSTQSTSKTPSDTVTVFDSCVWPPPLYADADGFTEITAQLAQGPGQGESSDATMVDRITGPCHQFRLTYDFGFQGDLQHLQPFTAPPGMVTSLDKPGIAWSPGVPALSFYPSRAEVDVVHNDHNALSDVKCAS